MSEQLTIGFGAGPTFVFSLSLFAFDVLSLSQRQTETDRDKLEAMACIEALGKLMRRVETHSTEGWGDK